MNVFLIVWSVLFSALIYYHNTDIAIRKTSHRDMKKLLYIAVESYSMAQEVS